MKYCKMCDEWFKRGTDCPACGATLVRAAKADAPEMATDSAAVLYPKADGLWLHLRSPDGNEAWINLSAHDHGPIVNAVIAETHRRL